MPNTKWIPYHQRQLLPSEEDLRRLAAELIARNSSSISGAHNLYAIPMPHNQRVQWYYLGYNRLQPCTPTIHALLYGQQLRNAPFSSQKGDSWHHGIRLQDVISFKDPVECAKWWELEFAACAKSVGVELVVRVQVVRLDGGS